MAKAEKVKVHVVDERGNPVGQKPGRMGIAGMMQKIKLGIAITLDVIDFFLAWIPIVNTVWDMITVFILFIILKNKALAFVGFIELPFIGLPPLSAIDSFVPIATITVLLDIAGSRLR